MKFRILSFILIAGMFLITMNVTHASERGSPKCSIEKQDAVSHVGDALHVAETVMPTIPGQVPLPNTPFVMCAIPETSSASTEHPPADSQHKQIVLYNLLC